jgi:hypothetical protein
LKISRKHFRSCDKPIHGLKKPKTSPQKSKSTRNQKSNQAQICCYKHFLGKKKKTINTNSSDQIEPFDTNIDNFGCLY